MAGGLSSIFRDSGAFGQPGGCKKREKTDVPGIALVPACRLDSREQAGVRSSGFSFVLFAAAPGHSGALSGLRSKAGQAENQLKPDIRAIVAGAVSDR